MELTFIGEDTQLFIDEKTQDVNCTEHIGCLGNSSAMDTSIKDIENQHFRNIRILQNKIAVQQKVAAYIKSDDFPLRHNSEKYWSIVEMEENIIKSLMKLKHNVMNFKETRNLSRFKLPEDLKQVTGLLKSFKEVAGGVLYENQGLGKQNKRKISKFKNNLVQRSEIRNKDFDYSDNNIRFETKR